MSASTATMPQRDDLHSLTSFGNPFSEEETDSSSYTIVSSLLTKVKNTFTAQPIYSSSAPTGTASPNTASITIAVSSQPQPSPSNVPNSTAERKAGRVLPDKPLHQRVQSVRERAPTSIAALRRPAPPLISMTPAIPEVPSYLYESDPRSNGDISSAFSPTELEPSTSIPGFPIQDDTRSIRTSNSLKRGGSASKVIRRLRGDGLSKDYWMDDNLCKECYDCKSVFTTWRRKHHCRICGQIYCSRCASNIIKGSRFGQDGVVRVCNLCLHMLEDDNENDDDDDHRSVTSAQSSPFPAHQLEFVQSAFPGPQSPFSAQNLLSHSYDSFNLSGAPESSRSHQRVAFGTAYNDGLWESAESSTSAAPFRRNTLDDDKDAIADSEDAIESYMSDTESNPVQTGTATATQSRVRPNVSISFPNVADHHESYINFPGSSSPDGLESPRPLRSRVSSFVTEVHAHTPPFLRSRVPSRLNPLDMLGEPGWRTRRESSAYAAELNAVSMFHLRVMLRQLLTGENIPHIKEWEETLLRLSLRVASHLSLNPRAPGASMDVRTYVKIKKIPGGSARDSEFVDGAVITKNVAHKSMVRDLRNPRIMLVTFPFDYHRVEGQFMAFDPLLAQEKEYLHNLVSRVASLRPHLVLVERSVSRLALDYLLKANIAVARTVKHTALQFVARATQGHILNSMDRLVTEPQMGHCARFKLQTFDHSLIPGRRKTYMRFEGCGADTACTIVLRGENIETLRRLKVVTSFMMFVVRNLKMETFLWKDTIISMPTMTTQAAPPNFCEALAHVQNLRVSSSFGSTPSSISDGLFARSIGYPARERARQELSRRIQQSVEPYLVNFISVSATLRFPPPYAIWRMKELDDRVVVLQKEWEDAETAAVLRAETGQSFLGANDGFSRSQSEKSNSEESGEEGPNTPLARNVGLPSEPKVDSFTPEHALRRSASHSSMASGSSSFSKTSSASSSAVLSSMLPSTIATLDSPQGVRHVSEITRESALHQAHFEHAEQRRIWEWYLRKNSDDFDVRKYQCIHVRQFIIPTLAMELESACFMPKLTRIAYYGENDCTLGQFIEDSIIEALDVKKMCEGRGCRKHLGAHSKVYVHNESRVVVAAEPWIPASSSDAATPMPDKIASFSVCRVCLQSTPFIPISDEALKYSFGKFLELHFYPADVLLIHGAGCEHNIYLHHIRYFAWQGMTVRFQTDPVDIFEIVLPPMRTIIQMEASLELKNLDYDTLLSRNATYWQSVLSRLIQLRMQAKADSVHEKHPGPDAASELFQRIEADRSEIAKIIHETYTDSRMTDTLALGTVRSSIQNKVVQWDLELERYEKTYSSGRSRILSEKDVRRMTGSHHFKRIYDDFFKQYASSASEIDEKQEDKNGERYHGLQSETDSIDEKQPLPAAEIDALTYDGHAASSNSSAASLDDVVDSDSTISAPGNRLDAQYPVLENDGPIVPSSSHAISAINRVDSRLPRWQGKKASVAELVQQFQTAQLLEDIGMVNHIPELPELPETDQEENSISPLPRRRIRSTGKVAVAHDSATSDFERSYAANIGPRHLAQGRGPTNRLSAIHSPSRIPALYNKASKAAANGYSVSPADRRPSDPSNKNKGEGTSRNKGKTAIRHSSRLAGRTAIKASVRLPPSSATTKVSNLARQFDRLSKDSDRASRRYALFKGRKARPVAVARATVEVYNSIREAVKGGLDDDDETSSDSSSEADDEDEGEGYGETDEQVKAFVSNDANISTSPVPPLGDALHIPVPMSAPNDHRSEHQVSSDFPLEQAIENSPTAHEPPLGTSPTSVISLASDATDWNISSEKRPSEALSGVESSMSMIGTVSGWWRSSQNIVALQYPFTSVEHLFAENSITIREDEPTSIIAFTLNSKDHRQAMSKAKGERMSKPAEHAETFMPDDSSESRSTWGLINAEDVPDPSELVQQPSSMKHLSFQFESGGVMISCVVFCAEQFEVLRRSCHCDSAMTESLARCLKWDATGGKSGSAFLKTRDDRFIAKELSKSELDSMTNFAPAYFDYMSNAISSKRPTVLAKIFGFYKVAFRNSAVGKTVRMNLLVMENVFYGRRFTRIYDLKGSMRNRHVQSTGRENEVLLDENLVQTSHLIPFYLREHSKRIIRGALWNDSRFLANLNIMDYSLLVGVDSSKNELVVGIVDYIRTYTWDKKLESWVKESAFLGGGRGGEPTIVTPKQYKARFRSAMERYFPLVPDRWTKQNDAADNEGDNLLELWPDW